MRDGWALGGGALALKLLYLSQYVELPFLYGPLFDSHVYLLQARRILEGRFADPALLAFSPLYGWLLAALHAVRGSILPILLQLGLGLLNLALVRRVTARALDDERAGLAAACLYLGYGPLLFFETKLMSETLGMSLLWLTLALLASERFTRASPSHALGAGACMALAILARASLLPAAPLVALASWLRRDTESTSHRHRRTLLFALGLGVVLALHGAWNLRHSGLFVPVIMVSQTAARATQESWSGDLSVFQGAGEQHVGAFSVVEQARARLARMQRGEPEPEAPPYSPWGYLRQLPEKLWLTLRDRETSFDYGFYGERTELWALRLTAVTFGALLVLACWGAAHVGARWRHLSACIAIALGTLLTTTMFHPSTRYRLPLVVLLLPLAGLAVARALTSRRHTYTLVAVLAGFALIPRELEHPGTWQLRLAESSLEEGDVASAARRIQRALALEPNEPQVRERASMLARRLSAQDARGRSR